MAKKINSEFKAIPKGEKIVLSYHNENETNYIVTENSENRYSLYISNKQIFIYLKSKNDPLFSEVYPEVSI